MRSAVARRALLNEAYGIWVCRRGWSNEDRDGALLICRRRMFDAIRHSGCDGKHDQYGDDMPPDKGGDLAQVHGGPPIA